MARLGEKRVDAVLEYERDIKGKGLIRLRAGVGAGKNYWVRHLPEKHSDLQILMITSSQIKSFRYNLLVEQMKVSISDIVVGEYCMIL